MDDQRIIELYFQRDERAIKETDLKYGRLCHSIAYNVLKNREDAEECVSDTYLGIWNAIPPTSPHNFMAFVCKIARNLSLGRLEMRMRQKRAHSDFVSLDELAEILPDERANEGIDSQELGRLLSAFLRQEKEDARNVFIRKYFFFDSVKDIADRYHFTESRVKNMLYHTRKKLKEYLISEGVAV